MVGARSGVDEGAAAVGPAGAVASGADCVVADTGVAGNRRSGLGVPCASGTYSIEQAVAKNSHSPSSKPNTGRSLNCRATVP